jgi:hypothetical protein
MSVADQQGSSAFLVTAPTPLGGRRFALAIVLASFVGFCALAPFARVPLPRFEAFIPIYESTLALIDLLTATLLFLAFSRSRLRAVLFLASGYLFTSLMAVPHMLTFPGLFSSSGLLGAGPQTTAWLYMFWHGGFPLFVICYALLRRHEVVSGRSHAGTPADIIPAAAGVVAGVGLLTVFATAGHQLLPRIMQGDGYTAAMVAVNVPVWLLSLVALAVLGSRPPYSILDLWLMVVVCASMFDVALSAVLNAGRFDHFESGSRKPSFDTLRRLANALEVTTDYLLGRVDNPGLAEAGDPLFRDVGKLTGNDRELAKDFLKMLAERSGVNRK